MFLWRLSTRAFADKFDGGYGLILPGRWNSISHAVTYCATSPSLCVLEKLVHVDDPDLLPPLVMIRYEVPDILPVLSIQISDLPHDWRLQEGWTQGKGDEWHKGGKGALLQVPSAIVPISDSPDTNVIINHNYADALQITKIDAQPFSLDNRLLSTK